MWSKTTICPREGTGVAQRRNRRVRVYAVSRLRAFAGPSDGYPTEFSHFGWDLDILNSPSKRLGRETTPAKLVLLSVQSGRSACAVGREGPLAEVALSLGCRYRISQGHSGSRQVSYVRLHVPRAPALLAGTAGATRRKFLRRIPISTRRALHIIEMIRTTRAKFTM